MVRLDLLDPASSRRRPTSARGARPVDLLVNNAIYQGPGIMDRVLETDPARVDEILRGNVTSPLRLVQRVLPGMLERKRGAIVNLVSAAGMSDPPAPPEKGGWGFAYGASKAALIRMAGCLAIEHAGAGVSFFSLEPGLILTESMRVAGPDRGAARERRRRRAAGGTRRRDRMARDGPRRLRVARQGRACAAAREAARPAGGLAVRAAVSALMNR